jgi:hypothetical protein
MFHLQPASQLLGDRAWSSVACLVAALRRIAEQTQSGRLRRGQPGAQSNHCRRWQTAHPCATHQQQERVKLFLPTLDEVVVVGAHRLRAHGPPLESSILRFRAVVVH